MRGLNWEKALKWAEDCLEREAAELLRKRGRTHDDVPKPWEKVAAFPGFQ